jgi:uncharacterized protein YdcH (DUF465 family)
MKHHIKDISGGAHTRLLIALGIILLLVSSNAQAQEESGSAQALVDQAIAGLKGTMRELSSLDTSDKKLAQSNQAQTDTLGMLKRAEEKIKTVEVPALTERGRLYDIHRQSLIDSGCPVDGGVVPVAVANRCNPLTRANNIEHEKILADLQRLKARATDIENTRQAVYKTTLANAKQQKANNARRDELQAAKLQLMSTVITRSLSLIADKSAAMRACESLEAEKAHCCLSVVSDGANPNQCDVELLYKVLSGGALQARVVVPQNR